MAKPLAVFAAALAATVLTYALVWTCFAKTSYVFVLFYERSWIQHATTFTFWLTIGALVLKHRGHRHEEKSYRRAQGIVSGPDLSSTLIWSDAEFVREKFAEAEPPNPRAEALSRIANGLDRLRKSQSTESMESYFRTRGEICAAELETSYAGLRFCVWLILTLGFVGTVLGIGFGIAGFAGVIQEAHDFKEIRTALPGVTGQLGTAFDTTLLALACSAVAVLYMSLLSKAEEQLLERIDTLCSDGICSLFQEHSTDSENIIRAIRDNVDQISRLMNGNRGSVEGVMRRELPALSQSIREAAEPLLASTARLASLQATQHNALVAELRQLRDAHERTSHALMALPGEFRRVFELIERHVER